MGKRGAKGKQASGPVTLVAVECTDGAFSETLRVDALHARGEETADQRAARETRQKWARNTVKGWAGPDMTAPRFVSVWSDGTRGAATILTAQAAVESVLTVGDVIDPQRAPVPAPAATTTEAPAKAPRAPRKAKVATASAPPPRACEACGQPTHKGYQWCEACAALADAADAADGAPVTAIAVKATASVVTPATDDIIPPGGKRGEPIVFTFGYDGAGTTAATFAGVLSEMRIATVIDTRIGSTTRAHGWSEKALRTALSAAYVVATGRGAVVEAVKAASSAGNVLLLRKEEAPGDSEYALELARLIPCIHVFRNEYIASHALQAAIDKDKAQGGDHVYECIADDGRDDAQSGQTAEKASA